jgi:hypothetical protein
MIATASPPQPPRAPGAWRQPAAPKRAEHGAHEDARDRVRARDSPPAATGDDAAGSTPPVHRQDPSESGTSTDRSGDQREGRRLTPPCLSVDGGVATANHAAIPPNSTNQLFANPRTGTTQVAGATAPVMSPPRLSSPSNVKLRSSGLNRIGPSSVSRSSRRPWVHAARGAVPRSV